MIPSPDPRSGAAEIAEGIFVFTSGAFAMTSTVVLGGEGGGGAGVGARGASGGPRGARRAPGPRPPLLIAPGSSPSDTERIAAFLEDTGAFASRIVLTHSDWDHVAGAARWPGAAVVAASMFPVRA